MELSPEERRRIYEEEKAHLEAQEQTRKEIEAEKTKGRSPSRACLGIILITIVLTMIPVVLCVLSSGKTATEIPPSLGEEGRLYKEGSDAIMVVGDEKAFEELINAVAANDYSGFLESTLAGRVFYVRNNTKVLVIDIGRYGTKVRILEGENTGMAGWVPDEWVVR